MNGFDLTWEEVRAAAKERHDRAFSDDGFPSWLGSERAVREEPYAPQEVLDEIALYLGDMLRWHGERPDLPVSNAYFGAQTAASIRDEHRPVTYERSGLGDFASGFVGSLMNMLDANRDDASWEAVSYALAAVEGSPEAAELAEEIRKPLPGLIDESLDWGYMLNLEKRWRRKHLPKPPRPAPVPGATPLADAGSVLRSMLEGCDDLQSVWAAFQEFAKVPLVAAGDERIDDPDQDGDMLLFEWFDGLHLTRQLAVLDDTGAYDRMEHVMCELKLDLVTSEVTFWGSVDELEAWVAEVEASPEFRAISSAKVLGLTVDQDIV